MLSHVYSKDKTMKIVLIVQHTGAFVAEVMDTTYQGKLDRDHPGSVKWLKAPPKGSYTREAIESAASSLVGLTPRLDRV